MVIEDKTERWLPVAGFEGLYEVSDRGRVRSIDHTTVDTNGVRKRIKGRVLNSNAQSTGYLNVHLSNGPNKKTVRVHRLVAEAFIPNPHGLPEVNHKDEDVTNNRVDNLEWCDRTYNVNYGGHQIRKAVGQGKKVAAILDGVEIARFESEGIAARLLGCSQSGISAAARGKARSFMGLRWSYV